MERDDCTATPEGPDAFSFRPGAAFLPAGGYECRFLKPFGQSYKQNTFACHLLQADTVGLPP